MIKLNRDNNYKIIIVGVGGTGSHLLSFLSQLIGGNPNNLLKHSILLIDADVVKEKNIVNQKFLLSDVEQNKAEILCDRYGNIYNHKQTTLDINFIDKYIDKESFDNIMRSNNKKVPIIVGCVDNIAARKVLDDYFNNVKLFHENIIYIDAGNSGSEGDLVGQVVIGYKSKGEIILPSVSHYFPLLEETKPTAGCGEILLENIQNIGANLTSAITIFNILNNIISFNCIEGDVFTFNASKIESQSLKIINNK